MNIYVNNLFTGQEIGTIENPFSSINAALSNAFPGDTIILRGSATTHQIYSEDVNYSTTQGTAENPITIRPNNGELVELRPNNGSRTIDLSGGGYNFINLKINNLGRDSDCIRVRTNNNLFRHCVIQNGARDGIDIQGNNTTIDTCIIFGFDTGEPGFDAHGIVTDGASGVLITGSMIYDCNGDCIQIAGFTENVRIDSNELTTTLGTNSENAIDVKESTNVYIGKNNIHGFRDSASSDGVSIVVHHEVVNIRITENIITDCDGGIRSTTSSRGTPRNVTIDKNIIHNLHDSGNRSTNGYGIQFDGSVDVKMYNNTFDNIPGPLFWIASRAANNFDCRNNAFTNCNSEGLKLNGSFTGNVNINYNGWFNHADVLPGSTNNVFGNPMYDANYNLQEGSPYINAGDPDFGTEFPGGRIDIGAKEFEESITQIKTPTNITIRR